MRRGRFDDQTVYADDPLAAARSFVADGARYLHVVDLDGARAGEPANLHHLERIAGELAVPVQYGGGLARSPRCGGRSPPAPSGWCSARRLYGHRPARRSAGDLGPRVLVAVDVRDGRVSVAGWTKETQARGEEVIERLQRRGATRFVYTNVDRDGMLAGPDLDEVRRVAAVVRGRFLYSGGIGSLADLRALRSLRLLNLAGDLRQGPLRASLQRARGQAALSASEAEEGTAHVAEAGHPVPRRGQGPRGQGRGVRGPARRRRPRGCSRCATRRRGPTRSSSWISPSHERRETAARAARRCADDVFIPFTIGGGVRSVADAQAVLDAGADKVSVNSAAVARPALLGELAAVFGAQCVVLAIDARRDDGEGYGVYVNGGRTAGGARRRGVGARGRGPRAGEILLTSMDRDGTEEGYELELTRRVADAVDVPVIASGGAGTLDHLVDAVVAGGADAVLCASIFHYGRHTVSEAKERMRAAGIPVRL